MNRRIWVLEKRHKGSRNWYTTEHHFITSADGAEFIEAHGDAMREYHLRLAPYTRMKSSPE